MQDVQVFAQSIVGLCVASKSRAIDRLKLILTSSNQSDRNNQGRQSSNEYSTVRRTLILFPRFLSLNDCEVSIVKQELISTSGYYRTMGYRSD